MNRLLWTAAFLLICGAPLAADGAPTVVEVFTSKFCPNCPAVDQQLRELADADPSVLVVFQHVDYWNRGKRIDPYSLADATQRQYDYSNSLSRRPGEVFTPMPILNGKHVSNMPMWLYWKEALAKAKADKGPIPLNVVRAADGSLKVSLPEGVSATGNEITLMGVIQAEQSVARRVRSYSQVEVKGPVTVIPAALVPKTDELVILLQKQGPQDIRAVAWVKK